MTIVHMLPGSGKSWLARRYPATFADGDDLYERAFTAAYRGRVHLLDPVRRRAALDSKLVVLTNDHEMADYSIIFDSEAAYLRRASKRADLAPTQLKLWYRECLLNNSPLRVADPHRYLFERYWVIDDYR